MGKLSRAKIVSELLIAVEVFIILWAAVFMPISFYEQYFQVFSQISLGLLSDIFAITVGVVYTLLLLRILTLSVELMQEEEKKDRIVKRMVWVVIVMLQLVFWTMLMSLIPLTPGFSYHFVFTNIGYFFPYWIAYIGVVVYSCSITLAISELFRRFVIKSRKILRPLS